MDTLYAVVSELKEFQRNRYVITLDNGHKWRQMEATIFTVKVGERIYIERGLLGSFYMGKEGLNRRMKVKRDE